MMKSVWLCVTAVVLIMLPSGFSLKCNTCFSQKSWDDCLEHSKVVDCAKPPLNWTGDNVVCKKAFLSKKYKNGQQGDQFAKSCFILSECNKERCRRNILLSEEMEAMAAFSCDRECCSTDNCNTGTLNDIAPLPQLSVGLVMASSVVGYYLGAY